MLRRIRILVNVVGNHLAQPCLLRKPLSRRTTNGMPSDFDWPRRSIQDWIRDRYGIWLATKAHTML